MFTHGSEALIAKEKAKLAEEKAAAKAAEDEALAKKQAEVEARHAENK